MPVPPLPVLHGKNSSLPKLTIDNTPYFGYKTVENPKLRWKIQTSLGKSPINEKEVYFKVPSDVSFLQAEIFVVAESEGHKLDVFNLSKEKSEYLGSFGTGTIWPNSVAKYFNDGGKILITDRKDQKFKIYDVERGDMISSFEGTHDNFTPFGIAMTSRQEIVVTDTKRNCVNVFSPQGKALRAFGKSGTLLEHFCLPFYCTVDTKDRIIVSDNMNYTIKVFKSDGTPVAFIGDGNHDSPHMTLRCPMGVACNVDGRVLVCDRDQNRIMEYDIDNLDSAQQGASAATTRNRKIVDMIIPEMTREVANSSTGCKNPSGVAVGSCGNMVYTEYSRQHASVKAYSLSKLNMSF